MPGIFIHTDVIEDIISYFDCDHETRDRCCCVCELKAQYESNSGKSADDIKRAPGVGRKGLRRET